MAGLIALSSSKLLGRDATLRLAETIDLYNRKPCNIYRDGSLFMAVSRRPNAPLHGDGLFEDRRWAAAFCGDVVERETLPFEHFISGLLSGDEKSIASLNGIFCAALYDKQYNRLYLVSDRRSQHPLYYSHTADSFLASTDLSTFCRYDDTARFNEQWLWEYLFFNYPVGENTFVADVKRMPPAAILEYDIDSTHIDIRRYSDRFIKKDELLDGADALALAEEVFSRRVPVYFEGADECACALTGGWDGRTMLALAPECDVTAYTYGMRGCGDIEGGCRTAKLAGVDHVTIPFDDSFVSELPGRMLDTVYYSSGLQGVLRATLLYVYEQLTRCGERFPVAVSGISFDMQFRGHACAPSLISNGMVQAFETGRVEATSSAWARALKCDDRDFAEHVSEALRSLERSFGPLDDPEHHLSYILYVLSSQYFSGELRVADHFTTVRVPSWDTEIIDLSYSIALSTLQFSQFFTHNRGDLAELLLQSHLLCRLNPRFGEIPVGNRRPDIVLMGRGMCRLYRILHGVRNRTARLIHGRRRYEPIEDWNGWLNDRHRHFIDELVFSAGSRVREYIDDDRLDEIKYDRDIHCIGKLATVETILRLMENGWEKFW